MCYLKVVWRLNSPVCVRQDSIFYTVCRGLFNYVLWSGLQDSSFLLYLTLQASIGQDIYSLWDTDGGCWILELWFSYKFWLFGEVRCSLWCSPLYQTGERKWFWPSSAHGTLQDPFRLMPNDPNWNFSAHIPKSSNGNYMDCGQSWPISGTFCFTSMPANIFLLATSFSRLPLHPEILNHSDYMFIRGGFGCLLTGIHEELAPEIAGKMEKKEACTDVYLHLGASFQKPGSRTPTPPPLLFMAR